VVLRAETCIGDSGEKVVRGLERDLNGQRPFKDQASNTRIGGGGQRDKAATNQGRAGLPVGGENVVRAGCQLEKKKGGGPHRQPLEKKRRYHAPKALLKHGWERLPALPRSAFLAWTMRALETGRSPLR
jgi:hypothetical protein